MPGYFDREGLRRLANRLECPVDEDREYENDRRSWGVWSFFVYWAVSGACISAYTTGSSLLAYGLSARQAIVCVVVGAIGIGLLSVGAGMPGDLHHVGFTVISRMSWGMRGSYIPVILRVFNAVWWFGIQSYWGGQAVALMLGALSPSFKHKASSIPASAHITMQDLVGVIIWYIMYIPLVMVPPEHLQKPFLVSSIAFICTLIGLLSWSVSSAGGGGPLFNVPNTASSTSFSMMLGFSSMLGSWGSGTIGQSDWIRYSNRRYYPMLSQLIAAPTMITACALTGIVITSASAQILGQIIWSPILLMGAIQDHYQSNPAVRAAVFFGGLGCTGAQLSLNVLLTAISTGMDMAGLWPKYLNIRRGAYILAILGLATNPWQILSSASTFLNVISGLGIFFAPATGILVGDYLVVRRRRVKVEDLYRGGPSSIYWYSRGFNWRTLVAFGLGCAPFWPGFIMSLIDPLSKSNWVKLFTICFPVGLAIGFTGYVAISLAFPPDGLDQGETTLDDRRFLRSVRGWMPGDSDTGDVIDKDKHTGQVLTNPVNESTLE